MIDGTKYGTNAANGNQPFAGSFGSLTTAKSAMPAAYALMRYKGFTDAKISAMYRGEMTMHQLLWEGEQFIGAGNTDAYFADGCGQRQTILFKIPGVFKCTTSFEPRFCTLDFDGTTAYAGTGWATGGTEWAVDHANWNTAQFPNRIIFNVNGWGGLANAGGDYAEGFKLMNVSLDGGKYMMANDPSYVSYGLAIRNAGSACKVENVVCRSFNTAGRAYAGGIPIREENTRSFYNGRFGQHFIGTALSTGTLTANESDDNGEAIIGMEPGFGQEGGGSFGVDVVKSEQGKNGTRPQTIIKAQGAYNLVVNVVNSSIYAGTCKYAFDLSRKKAYGTGPLDAQIVVNGFRVCGGSGNFQYLVREDGSQWSAPRQCEPVNFVLKNGVFSSNASPALVKSNA